MKAKRGTRNVPSQNVFVDRAVDWSTGVRMQFEVRLAGAAPATPNEAVVVFGRDAALCSFPLNSLVNTATSTINDTSTTINTDSVLREVLRLCDYKRNRLCRTTPTKLDTGADYTEMSNATFSVLADFLAQTEAAERPNGAWWDIDFINPTSGAILSGQGNYTFNGVIVNFQSGIPVRTTVGPEPTFYPIAIQFRATEKIVLSPFVFADSAEWETGLFGVNNIQLVFNMKSDVQRIIRNSRGNSRQISGVQYTTSSTFAPFVDPRVNVQYLTPSLDIPLPPKSIVQYMEFPRYLSTYNGTIAPKSTVSSIPSTTIVLPQIPDALLIYMKPQDYQLGSTLAGFTNTQADWYLPIKKITINFDNFAGLLSSHTAEQLYQMAVHNGLEMDYDMWSGLGVSARLGALQVPLALTYQPFKVQTVGGFLVLKPGLDITLQSGQAPGLIGNFTLQFNVDVFNPSTLPITNPILYVIAINSGFFETLAGSSRIVKGVLSEADIISAAPAAEMTHEGLSRMVGTGFMDKVGSFLTKAKDIYTATKPAVSAIKGMMPEGKVKDILGAVGYGAAGAGGAGGGRAGGAKKSLAARLM